jgi:hypothetical protein
MISSEEIYDKEVSPLIEQLVKACSGPEVHIPIVTCSTFWNAERDLEGSCCSASVKPGASRRMFEIATIARNRGKVCMSTFAKMMIGKPTTQELDADWYECTHEHNVLLVNEMYPLMMKIDKLVNETYHFPTAIVIQAPIEGKYMVIGKHPSEAYQGIQQMRVIAQHGYSQAGASALAGKGVVADMKSFMQEHKPKVKKEKLVVPLLRGNTPPPAPTREEVRAAKWMANLKKEQDESTKRSRAVEKKQKVQRRKKRARKKKKGKREGRWRTTNILNLV